VSWAHMDDELEREVVTEAVAAAATWDVVDGSPALRATLERIAGSQHLPRRTASVAAAQAEAGKPSDDYYASQAVALAAMRYLADDMQLSFGAGGTPHIPPGSTDQVKTSAEAVRTAVASWAAVSVPVAGRDLDSWPHRRQEHGY
jgi:hypothetical protein